VKICANPGLKERHWELISAHVGFSISPERDVPFKKLIDMEAIRALEQLEEISNNATREYAIEQELVLMLEEASA
jgi:dynein heavy chain